MIPLVWLIILAGDGRSLETVSMLESRQPKNGGNAMITMMIFHEVDDVEHWLTSPKREELFGPIGIKVRTFRDLQDSHRIGLIVETPDLETWHQALQTDEALAAMKYDGVRPDTIVELVEG
jgi:hypothetical protein